MLNKLCFLILLLHVIVQPPNYFGGTPAGFSPVCHLSSGVQNWTQHSSCSLMSARQRRIITSLHLVAMLLLIQPSRLLAFNAASDMMLNRVQFVVHQELQVLPQSCLTAPWPSACTVAWSYFILGASFAFVFVIGKYNPYRFGYTRERGPFVFSSCQIQFLFRFIMPEVLLKWLSELLF